MVLGLLGTIVLAVLLIVGGTILAVEIEQYKEEILFLVCLAATGLLMVCALRLGRMSVKDTLIFCKDEEDSLFVINLRSSIKYHRGLGGYAAMAAEMEQLQNKLIREDTLWYKLQDGTIREMACEILSVKNYKEQKDGYSVVCIVKYPNGRTGKATYLVYRGYEQEEELLYHLQRRLHKTVTGEVEKNPYPIRIAVSLAALLAVVALCVLSHPAFAILPGSIYFPCLALAYVPLCMMLYYIIKMKRGE